MGTPQWRPSTFVAWPISATYDSGVSMDRLEADLVSFIRAAGFDHVKVTGHEFRLLPEGPSVDFVHRPDAMCHDRRGEELLVVIDPQRHLSRNLDFGRAAAQDTLVVCIDRIFQRHVATLNGDNSINELACIVECMVATLTTICCRSASVIVVCGGYLRKVMLCAASPASVTLPPLLSHFFPCHIFNSSRLISTPSGTQLTALL
jgi:hypothetical protein